MKTRVLIVDDDPAMCTMLQVRLASRNLEVTTTTLPAIALDLVNAEDFDAVVTDINMKGSREPWCSPRSIGLRWVIFPRKFAPTAVPTSCSRVTIHQSSFR